MEFENELEQDTDLAINILPMIDVLFAILLFFIISSLILNRNGMIGINRPQTSINTPIDKKAIVISANKEGEIYINKIKSGPSTLAEDLGSIKKEVKTDRVLVDADASVQYGVVFNIIETAKTAGFESVSLLTDRLISAAN